MHLKRQQLRQIIREVLAESTELDKALYNSLEKAIVDSNFWQQGNTEDDGDYEDVPGLGLMHQTSAAQYLQDTLQNAINNAEQDIIIAVQSPELDANPGFLLTPDKPQYPDSVISGGYATVTPRGQMAVVLNMSLFDDSFNDDDVNAQRIARKGAAILRHEIVHLQQIAARSESEGISLLDAFENFKKEPKSIPPSGAGRQQYIKSHIEVDAHAHQAADELLSLYGKEEALRLISKTVDFEDLGVDLPHAIEDYLIDNPSGKTARQFRKKVYEYINSISEKVPESSQAQLSEASMGPSLALGYLLLIKPAVDILTDPKSSDAQKTAAALDIVEIIPIVGTPAGVANGLLKLSMNPPQYLSALGSFAAAILSAVGLGFVAKAGGTAAVITVLKNSTARKSLTKLINSLKGPLKESGPKGAKLAERLDNVLPAGKAVTAKLEKDVKLIKNDLSKARDAAIKRMKRRPYEPIDTGPGSFLDTSSKRTDLDWQDALGTSAKGSQGVPDIAYAVFAKKIHKAILENLPNIKNIDFKFEKPVTTYKAEYIAGSRIDTEVVKDVYSYDEVVGEWDKIRGQDIGFKDMPPQELTFKLRDLIGDKKVKEVADEMFDQFPQLKKVVNPKRSKNEPPYDDEEFAIDVMNLQLKVGPNPHAEGTAGFWHGIKLSPYQTEKEFFDAFKSSKGVASFVADIFKRNKGTWAHEFDHWLRQTLHARAMGVDMNKAWKVDYHRPDSSVDMKKWLSKYYEFEAEFTKAQVQLLDNVLQNGYTEWVAKMLQSPKRFESYFLEAYPDRMWQGNVGKDALKRVRKRLFDTEKGLYYALRRMGGIEAGKKKLPESALRELIQQIIKEA